MVDLRPLKTQLSLQFRMNQTVPSPPFPRIPGKLLQPLHYLGLLWLRCARLIACAGTSQSDQPTNAAFLKAFDRNQVLCGGFLLRSG
jgi:hypothetical protein